MSYIPLDGSTIIKHIEDCVDCSLDNKMFKNVILVLSFILVHLSSRFIILDLSPTLLAVADGPFLRRASIVAVIFLWTRSIIWTIIFAVAYFLVFFVVLHEDGYLITAMLKPAKISPFESVSIPAIAIGESNQDTPNVTQSVELTEDNIRLVGEGPTMIDARSGQELDESFEQRLKQPHIITP